MSTFSFRPVAAILAATFALACTVASAQQEEKVLNIYNWSDYIAEDTIKNFEKETGIKVRYDNFDNNEIVHAKLVAGKTGYDLVVPSSNWAKLQIDEMMALVRRCLDLSLADAQRHGWLA